MLCLLIVLGNDMPINKTVVLHSGFGNLNFIVEFRTICKKKLNELTEASTADQLTTLTEPSPIYDRLQFTPPRSTISEEPFDIYGKSTATFSLIIDNKSPQGLLCKYEMNIKVI